MSKAEGKPQTCKRCGTSFECGASTGECWCMSFEILTTVDASQTSCYCPDCLRWRLAQQAAGKPTNTGAQST